MEVKIQIKKVYYSKESWASVLGTIISENEDGEYMGSSIKAAGTIIEPKVGDRLILFGDYENSDEYGLEFKSVRCKREKINSVDGILSYLSSGFIKGIGRKKAKAIVNMFGLETLSIIENDPMKLCEVKGISEKTAKKISDSHTAHNIYFDLASLLSPEITDNQISKIYDRYKEKSVKTLKKNPYILIRELNGVGFKKADGIARTLGFPFDCSKRVQAGIEYQLKDKGEKEGHCFVKRNDLQKGVISLLGIDINNERIDQELKQMASEKIIYIENDNDIYLKSLYFAENNVALGVRNRLSTKVTTKVTPEIVTQVIAGTEKEAKIILEEKQKEAIASSFNNSLFIITGGPGTGKTTIINAIVKCYLKAGYSTEDIALCAPTGKAARRMTEVCALPANTIHRLLGFEPDTMKFRSEKEHLKEKVVIVDESSMLDIYLANALFRGTNSENILIMIGDVDQLPPIGAGSVFKDLVELPCVPMVKLNLSHRQKGKIAINANNINNGKTQLETGEDFFMFSEGENHEHLQELTIRSYVKMAKRYGVDKTCVLCPMRQKGITATNTLNPLLRDIMNPATEGKPIIKSTFKEYRVGDRVMELVNHHDEGIANGDVGYITDIIDDTITVLYDSKIEAEYSVKEADAELVLAYAITIHKSQGSEYKGCVIPLSNEHYIMLQRNLIYTAVTRAKASVVIVGNSWALNAAVRTVKATVRNTKLKEKIAIDIYSAK